ncbi:aaa family ATPase [Niveomyces insectorum RCEF 264]|uniref:Aaa family ATPase n=1 Tax=Niveomyces insectorum RCEF 264 TaxID=1081102 RepID=A0A167WX59_9HYPO|nr:aaa family ATPase [Niveomyces insectorum RCEF 264]
MPKSIVVNLASYQNEPPAKAASRVLVSKDNLILLTGQLENGRVCVIEQVGGNELAAPLRRREATLWVSPEPLKRNLARVSKAFREACSLDATEKWRITVPDGDAGVVPEAADIVVEDITDREGLAPLAAEPAKVPFWVRCLEEQMDLADVVFPGMVIRDVYQWRIRRTFLVKAVDGRTDNVARFAVDTSAVRLSADTSATTTLPIRTVSSRSPAASPAGRPQSRTTTTTTQLPALRAQRPMTPARPASVAHTHPRSSPRRRIQLEPIEGLDGVVEELNQFLSVFNPEAEALGTSDESCAIVLQGDEGTGKSMLLDRVAATGWGGVYPIRSNDKLSAIQETFETAYQQRPSIVTLDNIQDLLIEERSNRTAVIQTLCDNLDRLRVRGGTSSAKNNNGDNDNDDDEVVETSDPVFQPSTTQTGPETAQVIVLVTCRNYLKDVPAILRKPLRLDDVIFVPFPDLSARRSILRSFNMALPPDRAEAMIAHWSQNTHAFNGHDLWRLCYRAKKLRRRLNLQRIAQEKETSTMEAASGTEANGELSGGTRSSPRQDYLTDHDFEQARAVVNPSCMDGINVKPRPVYWHQIHGQQELVQALKEGVDMIHRPEYYEGLINPFPRGYLLYGPPGCSKTMAAQALATESGLNYFSVKGGELLNQYVGETERGVRDLFERAKRAAPAVIFLDEIDALGGRRSDFGDKSASSGRGPQMVPALLSEMDGFESLSKVLVLAATNRPEALDPALLRTGRFDSHFYVPPPDAAARRAILAGWARTMRVSHTDFDLDRLAERTQQYSGAELLGICQKAGHRTMRAFTAGQGPPVITTGAFEAVIAQTPKTITNEVLQHYEKWAALIQ